VKPLLDEARGTFGGEQFRLDEKTAAIGFRQSAPRCFHTKNQSVIRKLPDAPRPLEIEKSAS
jgi:hypothetical protein